MKVPFIVSLLLAGGAVWSGGVVSPDSDRVNGASETHVDMKAYCRTNPCRQDVHFQLRTEQGQVDKKAPFYWPVVQGQGVSVLSEERVVISGQWQGGRLSQPSVIDDASGGISFALSQNKGDLGMKLEITNPHDFAIKVRIDWVDFEGQLNPTSSCPVVAGGSEVTMWSHPIPELMISEIKKHNSKKMACTH